METPRSVQAGETGVAVWVASPPEWGESALAPKFERFLGRRPSLPHHEPYQENSTRMLGRS